MIDWILVICVLAIILSIFVAIRIVRCRHRWKPIGDVYRWITHGWSIRDLFDGNLKYTEFRQDIQCEKCGKLSWVKRQRMD